jgi:hypothetical protein
MTQRLQIKAHPPVAQYAHAQLKKIQALKTPLGIQSSKSRPIEDIVILPLLNKNTTSSCLIEMQDFFMFSRKSMGRLKNTYIYS